MFDAIDFKWNDEEKEAIKTLSIKAVTSKAECEGYPSCICLKKDLLLILKLIENQQAEIEKARNTKSIYYENKELRKELEKKNKIIDLMACTIYDYANLGKLKICDCELEDGKIDLNLCNQTLANRNCCDCIKEYFKNKVEE